MKDENTRTSAAGLTRRNFIVGTAAAGGGLAIGVRFPFGNGSVEAQTAADTGTEVQAWVVVKPDDTCVIRIARSEMGQGTLTAGPARRRRAGVRLEKGGHRIDHARAEPRAPARLGRDGHRRQPGDPDLAGLRSSRRSGRPHDAAAGRGR
jgi:hypothetical protein